MINWIRTAVVKWLGHKKPLPQTPLSDFGRIKHEIKLCDVVLVEGRSRVSEVIKLITQSSWSHAALYIGRLHDLEDPVLRDKLGAHAQCGDETQLIIESELGLGTVVRPLSIYEGEHLRAETTTSTSPVLAVIFGQAGLMAGASLEGVKYTRIIP